MRMISGGRSVKTTCGRATANHPNPSPASFAIILPHIGIYDKQTAKQLFRIGEIETVFLDIGQILRWIPFKNNCNSKRSYIKTKFRNLSPFVNIVFSGPSRWRMSHALSIFLQLSRLGIKWGAPTTHCNR